MAFSIDCPNVLHSMGMGGYKKEVFPGSELIKLKGKVFYRKNNTSNLNRCRKNRFLFVKKNLNAVYYLFGYQSHNQHRSKMLL
ncbi:MAG: hypothetical protein H6577_06550 [Lewinellaceae bacterium]|nr:hypothetical protein [Lewinellaceae bacterium]